MCVSGQIVDAEGTSGVNSWLETQAEKLFVQRE